MFAEVVKCLLEDQVRWCISSAFPLTNMNNTLKDCS